LLVLPLLSVGCRSARSEDCRQFVVTVNERLAAIDQLTQRTARTVPNAGDMRELSQRYAELGQRVAALKLRSPELVQSAASYRAMVAKASALAGQVAAALDARDAAAALKAQAEFGAVVEREDQLVGGINSVCRAP